MCNVFYQFETNGIPLDILIEKFYNSGYIIDWVSFVNDAFKIGWKKETVIKKIKYAFDDIEINDSDEILNRVIKYIESL
ncbi:hypothetical protein F485_gp039 [Aeromonas phage CC2]|uniref:Uncharacterized protein n=1 Tax=Aeromonas phage CC2 TaxID=1204516 RepID=I6XGS5_9CAUD|nr:hypothetical protein F485_gp039 [Aeromonas phage CC2]AFN39281.1 hypothetical protein CC2_360 [Aeromonas phage CC2]